MIPPSVTLLSGMNSTPKSVLETQDTGYKAKEITDSLDAP